MPQDHGTHGHPVKNGGFRHVSYTQRVRKYLSHASSMINVQKIHIAVMAILFTLPIKVIKIYAASCR